MAYYQQNQQQPYQEPFNAEPGPDYGQYALVESGTEELTKWMLNLDKEIQELEFLLEGKWKNPSTGKWEDRYWKNPKTGETEQKYTPMMNQKGVSSIMYALRFHLGKNPALSHLTEEDINTICLETEMALIRLLYSKADEFDIDKANLDMIQVCIEHSIYFILRRALGGAERDIIGKERKIDEVITRSADEQRRLMPAFGR